MVTRTLVGTQLRHASQTARDASCSSAPKAQEATRPDWARSRRTVSETDALAGRGLALAGIFPGWGLDSAGKREPGTYR